MLLVRVHNALGAAARFINFDEPIEDKKEVDAPIATLEKRSAARKRLHHTEGNDSLSLIWCQPRETLCAPSIGVDGSNARPRRKIATTTFSLSSPLTPSSTNAHDRRARHGSWPCGLIVVFTVRALTSIG